MGLFQIQIRGIRRKAPIIFIPPCFHVFVKGGPRPRRSTLNQAMLNGIVMYVIEMILQVILVTNAMLIVS